MPTVTRLGRDKFTYRYKGYEFNYTTAGELAHLMYSVRLRGYDDNPYEPDTLEHDRFQDVLISLLTEGLR